MFNEKTTRWLLETTTTDDERLLQKTCAAELPVIMDYEVSDTGVGCAVEV